MRLSAIVFVYAFLSLFCVSYAQVNDLKYSVKKIWDNDSHTAFTSIIKYKGKYYCSFREGASHIFDKNGNAEGKV